MNTDDLRALDARAARALDRPEHQVACGSWESDMRFRPTTSWADCGCLLDELERRLCNVWIVSRHHSHRDRPYTWEYTVSVWPHLGTLREDVPYDATDKSAKVAITLAACEALEGGKG